MRSSIAFLPFIASVLGAPFKAIPDQPPFPINDTFYTQAVITNDYVFGSLSDSQFEAATAQLGSSSEAVSALPISSNSNDTMIEASRIYGVSWRLIWDDPLFHYHMEKVDDQCNTYSSVFYPYTGFRVFHQYKWSRSLRGFLHSTHLVYCFRGRVTSHTSVENRDNQAGVNYQDKLCIVKREAYTPDTRGCYRIATRAEVPRNFPWFRSEGFIGGLFRCLGNETDTSKNGRNGEGGSSCICDNDTATPIAALVGDEPYMGLTEVHTPTRYAVRVPIAYTPDYFGYMYPRRTDAWARYIDIDSKYDYNLVRQNKQAAKANSPLRLNGIENRERVKQAYYILKKSLPGTDPFHREAAKIKIRAAGAESVNTAGLRTDNNSAGGDDDESTAQLAEFLSSFGLKALAFMRDKGRARSIYNRMAMAMNGQSEKEFLGEEENEEGMKTITVEEWREMMKDELAKN